MVTPAARREAVAGFVGKGQRRFEMFADIQIVFTVILLQHHKDGNVSVLCQSFLMNIRSNYLTFGVSF